MKSNKSIYGVLFGLLGLVVSAGYADTSSNPALALKRAAAPGFIIAPDGSSQTTFTLSTGQQANTTYQITRALNNTRPWYFGLVLPKGVVQTGGTCPQPLFQLDPGASCTVALQITADDLVTNIDGNYPQVCPGGRAGIHCTKPSLVNQLRVFKSTIPPAISTTLNVDATSIITVGSGLATITVTNTGTNTTHNVHAILPSGWNGVTQTSTNCLTLAPNASCTLSFSSTVPHVAQGIVITGDNVSNVPTTALAFRYQGGLVFSSTGTSPNATIKVVAETDSSSPRVWDAAPSCVHGACTQTNATDLLYGENLASVIGSTNPGGSGTNGPGDTYQVSSVLNGFNGNTNTPPATYAVGACISYTGSSYTDWYLPSVCEFGIYDVHNGGLDAGCSAYGLPNIATNLYLLGFLSDLANIGVYWSSSEVTSPSAAWYQFFNVGTTQGAGSKASPFGIRCVRSFTY